MKCRIIDILVNIADEKPIPEKIKLLGMVWTYNSNFGEYKNDQFQELIKYLHGGYNEKHCGLVYQAIYRTEVEILEDPYE